MNHQPKISRDYEPFDARTNQVWGAIVAHLGNRSFCISEIRDHKGVLTVYQQGLTAAEMVTVANLWETIGSEPPDNVEFRCNCCSDRCSGPWPERRDGYIDHEAKARDLMFRESLLRLREGKR